MAEKVLLIDDEKDFVEALAGRMKKRGMNVSCATSAAEALKKLEIESFDAIVLDLHMPGMDGLQTLEAIKKKNSNLQVVMLTGHATVEKGIEAMKLGAMDLIEKPADLETITQKIKKAQAKKMILVEKKTEQKIKKMITTKGW